MKILKREELKKEFLLGRVIQKAVGKDGASTSGKITMGFAHYSKESGPMEPHHHAEEVIFVISAQKAYVRFGPSPKDFGERIILEEGMTLHFSHLEWHVFEYDINGHLDIVFIYGQVDQIRPEEME